MLNTVTRGKVSQHCPICQHRQESWFHYLYTCPRVFDYWRLVLKAFPKSRETRMGLYDILNGFMPHSPPNPYATLIIALSVIFHAHTEAVYAETKVIVPSEVMLARFLKKIARYKVWGTRESEVPHPP
ncbi:hypothetical protein GQ42DRAFT_82939 [Ramicandelaber brevisporus]|nr:hypothetical protein GQ42DRAFT_82939 [Ramicandelaber brevisporus]